MRYLFVALLLTGCAAVEPYDVGPFSGREERTVPKCSDVTVSNRAGKAHWPECSVK